jgi:hypothetical protein
VIFVWEGEGEQEDDLFSAMCMILHDYRLHNGSQKGQDGVARFLQQFTFPTLIATILIAFGHLCPFLHRFSVSSLGFQTNKNLYCTQIQVTSSHSIYVL